MYTIFQSKHLNGVNKFIYLNPTCFDVLHVPLNYDAEIESL